MLGGTLCKARFLCGTLHTACLSQAGDLASANQAVSLIGTGQSKVGFTVFAEPRACVFGRSGFQGHSHCVTWPEKILLPFLMITILCTLSPSLLPVGGIGNSKSSVGVALLWDWPLLDAFTFLRGTQKFGETWRCLSLELVGVCVNQRA